MEWGEGRDHTHTHTHTAGAKPVIVIRSLRKIQWYIEQAFARESTCRDFAAAITTLNPAIEGRPLSPGQEP